MNKHEILNSLGYSLLLLWIISTITQIYIKEPTTIFWFCNIAILILSIACFQKSALITYSILAPALLFQLPWSADWILAKATNLVFLDLESFYAGTSPFVMVLLTIRHLIVIPSSIFILFLIPSEKLSKKYLLISLLSVLALLTISYLLPVDHNTNCIHKSCVPFVHFTGIPYTLFWAFTATIISFIILLLVKNLHKKYSNVNKLLKH